MRRQTYKDQSGFSIVECGIAMVVATVGLLSVITLLIYGVGMQTLSANATEATNFAKSKVEELRVVSPTDPNSPRAPGGSLTANVADHYDNLDTKYIRRWLVEAGPAGSQKVTVVVLPLSTGMRLPPTQIEVLLK